MALQDKKETRLTLIAEIAARDLYVPFSFCPLPELVYVMTSDEDEFEVQVYQAVPRIN